MRTLKEVVNRLRCASGWNIEKIGAALDEDGGVRPVPVFRSTRSSADSRAVLKVWGQAEVSARPSKKAKTPSRSGKRHDGSITLSKPGGQFELVGARLSRWIPSVPMILDAHLREPAARSAVRIALVGVGCLLECGSDVP